MSDDKHYQTAPEDRVSFGQKVSYGVGGLANNLLSAALGMMAIILNLGLKMDPRVVGFLMFLPRLTDAFTDPVMGFISDHTKTKWGRRRPYIVGGAIMAGVVFALLWQLREGQSQAFYYWYFLIGSIIFFIGYTIFATPWVALGYEMTPDYHERTRLMAYANYFGQIPWLLVPGFWWIIFQDRIFESPVAGTRAIAIAVGIVVVCIGVLPGLFCRERYKSIAESEVKASKSIVDFSGLGEHFIKFVSGFWITLKCIPFLKLALATFLVFNGFMTISGLTNYAIIYYVYGGEQAAAGSLIFWYGFASSLSTLGAIWVTTKVSQKYGKKNAFYFSTGVSILGYALKWFCYSPTHPFLLVLPTPLISFGLGGLFTLMGAMVADVCDYDELKTGQRREGMFGSIFWWNVKLGVSVALLLGGYLLVWTGFDVELGTGQSTEALFLMRLFDVIVPIVASSIAIGSIATYEITEEKAREIRAELEKRRGKATA
jgi:GPH family glycoside/pentoside/hexuronide:cation symporter